MKLTITLSSHINTTTSCAAYPTTSRRRKVRLKGRNMSTIQLPLRHLKGVCIRMTPLSDWLNMLQRGCGIAELPLPPKTMLWACCIVLALKSYGNTGRCACKHGTYVMDLHKTIHLTCKACMSFVTCQSIEYWGAILI